MSDSRGVMVVGVKDFEKSFEHIIDDFLENSVKKPSKGAVRKGGIECRKQLKETSPSNTGRYASGWKMRTKFDGYGGYYVRIYNDVKPGLTHLLEFGHEKFVFGKDTGERVPAHPHIAEAAEHGEGIMLREMANGKV